MSNKMKFYAVNLGKSVTAEVTEKSKIKTEAGQILYLAKAIYKGFKVCRFITKSIYSVLKVKSK